MASLVVQTMSVAWVAYPRFGAIPIQFISIFNLLVSMIHYGFLQRVQSPFDQRWRSQGKPYRSMWAHGLLAWFVGRLVLNVTRGVVLTALLKLGL